MSLTRLMVRIGWSASVVAGGVVTWAWWSGSGVVMTSDQRAVRAYQRGEFGESAAEFTSREWRATALFRDGQFKESGVIFSGIDTADGAFNHGNALLMQGLYESAASRYQRALALRPGWQDAETNLSLALARAELMEMEGGEMTGGKLAADDYVFGKGKPGDDAGEEVVDGGEPMSDKQLRALWLRRVQTKPADFLRSKFSYQQAVEQEKEGSR